MEGEGRGGGGGTWQQAMLILTLRRTLHNLIRPLSGIEAGS